MPTIAEKLTEIASKTHAVYNRGYDTGFGFGYDKAIYDGSEFKSLFWNAFQQNGNRVNYDYGFYGGQWTNKIFTPEHDMKPTSAKQMFLNNNFRGDLVEALDTLDVVLDFSICKDVSNLFAYAKKITHIGTVNMSSATSIAGAFVSCEGLESIDEVIFNGNGTQHPGTTIFKGCAALKNITVSGVIGDDISFKDSHGLTRASIESIVDALSTTASDKTLSLSQNAVGSAFDWDFSGAWTDFIAKRSNWNISLFS